MFQKVREAAKSAVATVDSGMKKLSYRSEIYERRNLIHKLKSEWGCFIFDHMEKKHRDQKVLASYEVLKRQIADKQFEIHQFEEKILTLHSPPDSVIVKHKKMKKKTTSAGTLPADDKKFNCIKCSNLIVGERMSCGKGVNFHPACFTCFSCNKDLKPYNQIFLLHMQPYCDDCGEQNVRQSYENINEDELLRWVQNELRGFNQIEIIDFDPINWRNGLVFAALCVKYRPDLIRWKPLTERFMNAFPAAQAGLDGLVRAGVTMLFLEASELVDCDERSIILQVAVIRKFFQHTSPSAQGMKEWNLHIFQTGKPSRHLDQTGILQKENEILVGGKYYIDTTTGGQQNLGEHKGLYPSLGEGQGSEKVSQPGQGEGIFHHHYQDELEGIPSQGRLHQPGQQQQQQKGYYQPGKEGLQGLEKDKGVGIQQPGFGKLGLHHRTDAMDQRELEGIARSMDA